MQMTSGGNIKKIVNKLRESDKSLEQRIAELEALEDLWEGRGGVAPGIPFWWGGKFENRPKYTVLCNGASYSKALYPVLYAAIGDIYNTDFGQADAPEAGYFRVQNGLDGNGRYIRMCGTDEEVGTKQDNSIINIIGKMEGLMFDSYKGTTVRYPYGSFTPTGNKTGTGYKTGQGNYWCTTGVPLIFDANSGLKEDNPSAGYIDTEVRPNSMYQYLLIAYK